MKKTTEKSDMWSAGCILYELLSGSRAFDEGNPELTNEKILKGDYSMHEPAWDNVSVQAKDFVRKLLQFNTSKRPSASEALEHIWIKSNNELYPKETPDSTKCLKECLTNMKLHKVKSIDRKGIDCRQSVKRGFQQACWLLMSLVFIKNYEKNNILKAFTIIDDINDGQLTKQELIKGKSALFWPVFNEKNSILEVLEGERGYILRK